MLLGRAQVCLRGLVRRLVGFVLGEGLRVCLRRLVVVRLFGRVVDGFPELADDGRDLRPHRFSTDSQLTLKRNLNGISIRTLDGLSTDSQ